MVCSKRMQSYTHLEQEDDLVKPTDEARKSLQWPMKGEITFTNVTMRYQPELDPALKSVSFTASPGMKIGIVGRTGSGKSSVL
jgi:ABC-type multidrug transport system fused ATPase/permease subunit